MPKNTANALLHPNKSARAVIRPYLALWLLIVDGLIIHRKNMRNHLQHSATTNTQIMKRAGTRSGATLVEALIAVALFAGFITGACKLIVAQRMLADTARAHYTAANIAKNRMELVRSFDFDQISSMSEDAVVIDEKGIPRTLGNFSRTTAVTWVDTNLYALAITVKVRNQKTLEFDGTGQVLNTYISKHL